MLRMIFHALAFFSFAFGAAVTIEAREKPKRVKYAKSEVDKAVGKCIGTVLGGALLGALIAGKRDRAEGALAGAAIGGGLCAIIVNDAKKKDRMFEAQLYAAQADTGRYSSTFTDDGGARTVVTASAGEPQILPASRLIPVSYTYADKTTRVSPILPGPDALCRFAVASVLAANGAKADSPTQLSCRTENGDWAAYNLNKTQVRA